ncbi:MAG: hypothetical protein NZ700_16530, partial [Gemmataceae bacterium]|nr:hypothetical protein [Gemmataceae bacterium]
ALATSVHLVCRPRPLTPNPSPSGRWEGEGRIGDWSQVLRELPRRVAEWMQRLQAEGVRGADLVFACIGPALEIYSRYAKVVDAEEREIPLGGDPEATEPHRRGFLAYVWEVVGRAALEQVLGTAEAKAPSPQPSPGGRGRKGEGLAGALEEDARLTALFLWTLQTTDSSVPSPSGRGAEGEDQQEEDAHFDLVPEEEGEDEEDEAPAGKKKKGLTLPFDVVRRFAQPLGIHLETWEGRIIETKKGVVRLLPVMERVKQLFGEQGAEAVAARLESLKSGPGQLSLFDEPPRRTRKTRRSRDRQGAAKEDLSLGVEARKATTLDKVHMAMVLQASGQANALRVLLKAEVERGPDFLRLANALSALYPPGSDEKRLLDAMLLAVPR